MIQGEINSMQIFDTFPPSKEQMDPSLLHTLHLPRVASDSNLKSIFHYMWNSAFLFDNRLSLVKNMHCII
jgi:hypothetical protein